MVNHKLKDNTDFWAPPGGGLEFGQTISETIIREFKEETNIDVTPGQFMFGCEFIDEPLHAIELFFEVVSHSQDVSTGFDPELQIILEARFMTSGEIKAMPVKNLHGIFRFCKDVEDLRSLKGFYSL